MRNGYRVLVLMAAFVTALPMVSAPAAADGVAVRHDSAIDAWSALSERDQFCIINYDKGIEKMIISIQLDASELDAADGVVWMIPVPSAPEKVTLRLMSIVPRLNGEPLHAAVAHEVVDDPTWFYAYSTQLYVAPFAFMTYIMSAGFGTSGGLGDDVQTFGSVIGYGLTSEVVSTRSSEALDQYLALKNLSLPGASKGIVDEYVGEEYSLVLSWVSNMTEFRSKAMKDHSGGTVTYVAGLAMEFPSDRIFFPLKLTGAYGDLEIPITVQVLGQVGPTSFPTGNGVHVTWRHCLADSYEPVTENDIVHDGPYVMYRNTLDYVHIRRDFVYFFDEQSRVHGSWPTHLHDVHYTEVRISGSASGLDEDLWISDTSPASVSVASAIGDNPWFGPIAVLFFASFLAGMVTSSLVFRGHSVSKSRFGALGLLNALTLLAVYLGYVFLVERKSSGEEGVFFRLKCARFVWTFSAVFLGLMASAHVTFLVLSTGL